MGLLGSLFGPIVSRKASRRWVAGEKRRVATEKRRRAAQEKRERQAEKRRQMGIARTEAKLRRERLAQEKRERQAEKRRARAEAKALRERERDEERQRRAEDKRAKRLGLPTWRNPRRGRRRNPADAADLERAQRMSEQFHGDPGEVIELEDHERRLPRYVVALGEMPEMSYEASPKYSQRAGWKWVHESGDRGDGQPRGRQRPVLAADPATGRPLIVPMRSPVRFNSRKGLVG